MQNYLLFSFFLSLLFIWKRIFFSFIFYHIFFSYCEPAYEKINLSNYNEFNFYSTENNKKEEMMIKMEENSVSEQKQNFEKVRVEDLFLSI